MTDYTTPLVGPLTSPDRVAMVPTGFGVDSSFTAYGALINALSKPSTTLMIVNQYDIAGTYQAPDTSYKPPKEGQLWPRGDLDAT